MHLTRVIYKFKVTKKITYYPWQFKVLLTYHTSLLLVKVTTLRKKTKTKLSYLNKIRTTFSSKLRNYIEYLQKILRTKLMLNQKIKI